MQAFGLNSGMLIIAACICLTWDIHTLSEIFKSI